ncbi:MAG: nucleoside-diphosphate-sugar epimerase [bacterium]|jgi:nucleoside-diphosphate-sugar epimerase
MKILVTGAARFIVYHLSKAFLKKGHTVVGIEKGVVKFLEWFKKYYKII